MTTHLILMNNADGSFTPLYLEFRTLEQCKADIEWQRKGGFDPAAFTIQARDELHGLQFERGFYSLEHWLKFLNRVSAAQESTRRTAEDLRNTERAANFEIRKARAFA